MLSNRNEVPIDCNTTASSAGVSGRTESINATYSTSNNSIIILGLTDEIKHEEIVTNFVFDKKSNHLILSLNHRYSKKTIVSPLYENDWPKTIRTITKQVGLKGLGKIGSGTTLLDVLNLKRQTIGIDIDPQAHFRQITTMIECWYSD